MTMPARQQEARVFDNRLVRPGDQVQVLPVKKDGDDLAQQHYDSLRNWLGDGPFTVSWIGKWPCGRIILYLKGAKTGEPGAFASDFM